MALRAAHPSGLQTGIFLGKVLAVQKQECAQKNNRMHLEIIITLTMEFQ